MAKDTTTVRIEDVDPVFADNAKGQQKGTSQRQGAPSLEDLDPIFKDQITIDQKGKGDKQPESLGEEKAVGAGIGATTGAAASMLTRMPPPPPDVDLRKLQMQRDVAGRFAKEAADVATAATAAKPVGLDELSERLRLATANRDAANAAYRAALEKATSLNALPEPVTLRPAATLPAGSSELPFSLSEGALRHSEKMGEITEANLVRKGIAGTREGLPAGQRSPLGGGWTQSSRLIVPASEANAPIYNQAQLAAQKELAAADAARNAAIAEVNKLQTSFDKLTSPTRAQGLTTRAQAADLAARKATIAAEEAAKMEPGRVSRLGYKLPGMLPIAGGAFSGYELVNAYDAARKGDYLDAFMAGLGGVGGALSLVPFPAVRGAGMLLSAPPLAYEAYKAYRDFNKQ